MLPGQIDYFLPRFLLFQYPDNLLFVKPALLHYSFFFVVLADTENLNYVWLELSRAGQYADPNAPQSTFIYDFASGVALNDYGDALPGMADWNNLAQTSNPYNSFFQTADTYENLLQFCPPAGGPLPLPCLVLRSAPFVLGGAAVLIAILKDKTRTTGTADEGC